MKLKIKGEENKDIKKILLERYEHCVNVTINGEMIASFWASGEFRFYGHGNDVRYKGKWDK